MMDRYEQVLRYYMERMDSSLEQLGVAICLTKLERYPEARGFYGLAIHSALGDGLWLTMSQPDQLVCTFVLAGQPSLRSRILRQVEGYKLDPRGDSLVAYGAYAVLGLATGNDSDAQAYVQRLLAKPGARLPLAMGKVIEATIQRSQSGFDTALDTLLLAHRGMAKFGALRETPEGFLCLPAMSLAKIALQRGLSVDVISEYLSKGYLRHLLAG